MIAAIKKYESEPFKPICRAPLFLQTGTEKMELTVKDIVEATGGRLARGVEGADVTGVSIDSRSILPGDAFVAISGENFDGHSFVPAALKNGAGCVVIEVAAEQSLANSGMEASTNVIVVEDTIRALGDLAARIRADYKRPVIAVGGSSGKTTTKEMIASILARCGSVLKTEGNKNNLIGVPLTLFGLDHKKGSAVVELGISEAGEMDRLVDISMPDIGVLTNIGRAHIEGLGSMDKVAKEKFKLFDGVMGRGKAGMIAVNMDDERIAAYAEGLDAERLVTFGSAGCKTPSGVDLDVIVKGSTLDGDTMKVEYLVRGEAVEVSFPSPIRTNAINGAAAIAATLPLGVELENIVKGLSSFTQPAGRMEVLRAGKVTLLDDSYNANPDSVGEALLSLSAMAGGVARRSVAVLGDMLELGQASERLHRELGVVVAGLDIDLLVTVGEASEVVSLGAKGAGMEEEKVMHFADNKALAAVLEDVIMEGDIVLVKGSRSSRMEEAVEAILKAFGQ